ncbi:MAG: hypothetical protein JWQ12_671 [Glaciihabitans sp.]|nr:hypothetical protein [Glaciihabitans sp.]
MITDQEIRNVAASRKGAEGEVIIGLLDRILKLERRISNLEAKDENGN